MLDYALTNRKYSVAHPEVVIDRLQEIINGIQASVYYDKSVPAVGQRLRPEFLEPDESRRLRGRCVVLRKDGEDDRNSQDRDLHWDF